MSKVYVITSGYYNPIHPGHIDCMELAAELGDELWVIVNNDAQAVLKRGKPSFQDEQFRMRVVSSLKPVDEVVLSIDDYQLDGGEIPVIKTLRKVCEMIRSRDPQARIIFAKGGDRSAGLGNIPESVVFEEFDIELRDGLGAKTHHSRDYITVDNNKESSKYIKDFDGRNSEKQYLDTIDVSQTYINPREIWYAKLGVNVGVEQNGKKLYRRPVLVIKKIGSLFLVVPMTTKLHHAQGKNKAFYHVLETAENIDPSALILSQIKVIDKKRFMEHKDTISEEEIMVVKEKIKDLCL